MKYFLDTHDRKAGSFPTEEFGSQQFLDVYNKFDKHCEEEGITLIQAHVNLKEGKAFCITKAPSREAIKRAHEKINLPYTSLVEINTITAGNFFGKKEEKG